MKIAGPTPWRLLRFAHRGPGEAREETKASRLSGRVEAKSVMDRDDSSNEIRGDARVSHSARWFLVRKEQVSGGGAVGGVAARVVPPLADT